MNLAYLRKYRRVYLATPYSKLAPALDYACDLACILAARMIREGVKLYCPIAECHSIATRGGLDPLDAPFWMEFIRDKQSDCDALVVGKWTGWHESDGISGEIAHAALIDQPVYGIDPDFMKLTKWGFG
jgi:hypothetical protein